MRKLFIFFMRVRCFLAILLGINASVYANCDCCNYYIRNRTKNVIDNVCDWHDINCINLIDTVKYINSFYECYKTFEQVDEGRALFSPDNHMSRYWTVFMWNIDTKRGCNELIREESARLRIDNNANNQRTYKYVTDRLSRRMDGMRNIIKNETKKVFEALIEGFKSLEGNMGKMNNNLYSIDTIFRNYMSDHSEHRVFLRGLGLLLNYVVQNLQVREDTIKDLDVLLKVDDNIFKDSNFTVFFTAFIERLKASYEHLKGKYLIEWLKLLEKKIPVAVNHVGNERPLFRQLKITIAKNIYKYNNIMGKIFVPDNDSPNIIYVYPVMFDDFYNLVSNNFKDKNYKQKFFFNASIFSDAPVKFDDVLLAEYNNTKNNVCEAFKKFFEDVMGNVKDGVSNVENFFLQPYNQYDAKNDVITTSKRMEALLEICSKYKDKIVEQQDSPVPYKIIKDILTLAKMFPNNGVLYDIDVQDDFYLSDETDRNLILGDDCFKKLCRCVNIYFQRYTEWFKEVFAKKIKNANEKTFETLAQWRDLDMLCKENQETHTLAIWNNPEGERQLEAFFNFHTGGTKDFPTFHISSHYEIPCVEYIVDRGGGEENKEITKGLNNLAKFIAEKNKDVCDEYAKCVFEIVKKTEDLRINHRGDIDKNTVPIERRGYVYRDVLGSTKYGALMKIVSKFIYHSKDSLEVYWKSRNGRTYMTLPFYQDIYDVCDAWDIKYRYKLKSGELNPTVVLSNGYYNRDIWKHGDDIDDATAQEKELNKNILKYCCVSHADGLLQPIYKDYSQLYMAYVNGVLGSVEENNVIFSDLLTNIAQSKKIEGADNNKNIDNYHCQCILYELFDKEHCPNLFKNEAPQKNLALDVNKINSIVSMLSGQLSLSNPLPKIFTSSDTINSKSTLERT
ncbi:MAG: hypothetical protein II393_01495, partial [Cytophagales bacterium]|nr:hypothetical protein [Cytophagales bacterium]